MDKFSFLGAAHTNMIEEMYDKYLKDSSSIDEKWRNFFQGFDFAQQSYVVDNKKQEGHEGMQIGIEAYRKRGHLFTLTNPVRDRRKHYPSLDYTNFGLEKSDEDVIFQAGNEIGLGPCKLSVIIDHLNIVYCQSIGVEFMYIRDPKRLRWMIDVLHQNSNTPKFDATQKIHILHKLNQAVAFENFLHKRNLLAKKDFLLKELNL